MTQEPISASGRGERPSGESALSVNAEAWRWRYGAPPIPQRGRSGGDGPEGRAFGDLDGADPSHWFPRHLVSATSTCRHQRAPQRTCAGGQVPSNWIAGFLRRISMTRSSSRSNCLGMLRFPPLWTTVT